MVTNNEIKKYVKFTHINKVNKAVNTDIKNNTIFDILKNLLKEIRS